MLQPLFPKVPLPRFTLENIPSKTGELDDYVNFLQQFVSSLNDMPMSKEKIKMRKIIDCLDEMERAIVVHQYQDNTFIKALLDYPDKKGGVRFHSLLTIVKHGDNENLHLYIEHLLDGVSDLSRYPISAHDMDTQCISDEVNLNILTILSSPWFYTFFVDRVYSDTSQFHSRTYGKDMFGSGCINNYFGRIMFGGSDSDCNGNYLDHCFKALTYLYNCNLSFSQFTDPLELFSILAHTNQLALGIGSERHLYSIGDSISGGDGYINLFYDGAQEFDDPRFGSRAYRPDAILNPDVNDEHDDRNCVDINDMTLKCLYDSKEVIVNHFSVHLKDYHQMLKQAETPDEKTTAIIIFISLLEASHYFVNGNNRLFCQMLLNKLLIENDLPQTILYVPNGFSRYVLGILPWQVRIGAVRLSELTISDLKKRLEPALMIVHEGQNFFSKIQR